jgi:acyl transferase domain-containing protein
VTADRPHLCGLSADDPAALDGAAEQLAALLADQPGLPAGELAGSLARRPAGRCRLALVARSAPEAAEILLAGAADPRQLRGEAPGERPSVVFLYPGVGDHQPAMVARAYQALPTFRAALDGCAELALDRTGNDPRAAVVEPVPGWTPPAARGTDLAALLRPPERPDWLDSPVVAQAAVFAVEYALTSTLARAGLAPDALLGYSIGEYVAAAVAGVLPVGDAVELVGRRAELITKSRPGGMLAVLLGPDDLADRLAEIGEPELTVGAVDGPTLCVASGPAGAVDRLERLLTERGVASRRLATRHAFHSPLLAELEAPLEELVDGFAPRPPRIPVLSNVTGGWLAAGEATRGGYWARHMSRTVRFADNLREVWRLPAPALVEVGPGQLLGTLAMSHPDRVADRPVLSTLRGPAGGGDEVAALLAALGRAWTRGLPVDLGAVRSL